MIDRAEVERRMRARNCYCQDSVSVAVEMLEEQAARAAEPPYPYVIRTHVQRLNTKWHRLVKRIECELVPRLQFWKQRYKSAHGSLIQRAEAAEKALADVLNYWEPSCQTEDCDKGYHVEALHAWKKAYAVLGRRAPQEKP